MKILVTGAAGAIGSHLAERLLKNGHTVVGVDSFTPYYSPEIKKINSKELESAGIMVVERDLAEDDISDLIEGVDVVFHMAAQPGISSTTPFEDYLKNNIVATQRLLEQVRKSNSLKMFFHASTSSIYGARANGNEASEPKPTSYYGVTKLAAEQLAMSYYRELGLPVCVLRLFSVYGERERPEKFFHKLIKAMYEEVEVPLYEGSEYHVRSYTYVGDIIDGCMLALENIPKVTGEIFNLGSDQTATTGEGIKIVESIMGKKAKIKVLPRRSGDQFETAANIEKIRTVLGYNPHTKLEEGLRAQVLWYGKTLYGRLGNK